MKHRIITAVLAMVLFLSLPVCDVNASGLFDFFHRDKTEEEEEEEDTTEIPDSGDELTSEQNSSIAMLNYITTLSQEINASKNSRLYLEEVYSSLISNTNPNAVDYRTQVQLEDLLDTLEDYRMITVKRDRLQYIYEQNKAQAIRSAVPNPIGLLSAASSGDWVRFAAAVGYMAVDSITSYQSASSEADLKYLQDGWALDDKEAEVLHNSRKSAFVYMLEMVRENDLPGNLALSEENVAEFVSWKNKTNVAQKIRFFERNESTYAAFGYYWLTLAENYYENGDYQKCIDSVKKYTEIQPPIVRKDHDLAKALPLAITSAKKVLSGNAYKNYAENMLGVLEENLDNSDWSLRYYAALTYMDLYRDYPNESYLDKAFNLALDNVNGLIEEQRKKNEDYLSEIKQAEIPKDATKAEKKEIKQYNKLLKKERKTALPQVYEPLTINCDLLFSLAESRQIDENTQTRINSILHEKGKDLFLTRPLDQYYTLGGDKAFDIQDAIVSFTGKVLTIPAEFVSDSSTVKATVSVEGKSIDVKDWQIKKVDRKKAGDISTFYVTYVSKDIKKVKFSAGSKVAISITPRNGTGCKNIKIKFNAEESKMLFFKKIKFVRE